MGRKLKRGKAGNAVQYVTRTQALRKLQLHLSTFRRLCILKGIHPREPRRKTQGAQKTYYHVKDINFLAHDPLLDKFREQWSYEKKIKKATARKERDLAERLASRRPTYRIDHLVKERYPTFVDALRDLDDPLTLVHLFATLPADSFHKIPAKAVQTARRLSMEFQAFVVRTHALRKVFVSVKGFYFQAEVQGQLLTWLVLPVDVDYKVMLTFLEFYSTLLQFVNFRLYHGLGVRYPPVIDPKMEEAAEALQAIMQDLAAQKSQPEAPALPSAEQPPAADPDGLHGDEGAVQAAMDTDGPLTFVADAAPPSLQQHPEPQQPALDSLAGGALGVDSDDDALLCECLFRGLVFFLGREVPQEPLLFVIRAFGGTVAWDGEGSPLREADESVTHQVVDRPTQGHRFMSREYVQPQWVMDSANFRVLARTELYVPGIAPPPHLSPFAATGEDEYVPDYLQTMRKLQDAATAVRKRSAGDMEAAAFLASQEQPEEIAPATRAERDAEQLYQAELQRELQADLQATESEVFNVEEKAAAEAPAKAPAVSDELLEPDATVMMTSKTRGLYNAMQRGKKAKRQRVEKLQGRKAALAAGKK
eukprot:jgi/Astpho2/2339/Aster-05605